MNWSNEAEVKEKEQIKQKLEKSGHRARNTKGKKE